MANKRKSWEWPLAASESIPSELKLYSTSHSLISSDISPRMIRKALEARQHRELNETCAESMEQSDVRSKGRKHKFRKAFKKPRAGQCSDVSPVSIRPNRLPVTANEVSADESLTPACLLEEGKTTAEFQNQPTLRVIPHFLCVDSDDSKSESNPEGAASGVDDVVTIEEPCTSKAVDKSFTNVDLSHDFDSSVVAHISPVSSLIELSRVMVSSAESITSDEEDSRRDVHQQQAYMSRAPVYERSVLVSALVPGIHQIRG